MIYWGGVLLKIKHTFIFVLLLLIVSIILCSVFAYNAIVESNQNTNTTVQYSTTNSAPQGKLVPVITVTMKPSVDTGLPYKSYTRSWVNYCPFCHKYGTLTDTPKDTSRTNTVPEGEITCDQSKGGCDADFDGVTGKDKLWRNVYLIPVENSQIFGTGNARYTLLDSYDIDSKSIIRTNQLLQFDVNNGNIVGTSYYRNSSTN